MNPVDRIDSTKKEEQQKIPQQQIVAYRGRQIHPLSYAQENEILFITTSFKDRLLFGLSQVMDVNFNALQQMLPKQIFKMLDMMDALCGKTNNVPAIQNFFGIKIEYTVEEQIKREESALTLTKQLHESIEHQFDMMRMQKQQQLIQAGVTTSQELEQKKQLIASYKLTAEEKYLQDPINLQTRKEIDKELVLAFKGTLSKTDEKIVDDYWELNSKGDEVKEKIKGPFDIRKSTGNVLESIMEKIEKSASSMEQINAAQVLHQSFQEWVNITGTDLVNARKACLDPEEAAIIDYNILTGSYVMPTIINVLLRNQLAPQLAQIKERLSQAYEFAKNDNERTIQSYQKSIKGHKDFIEEIRELDPSNVEHWENRNKEYEELILQMQSKTRMDLEILGCSYFNMQHPREFEKYIPQEKPFETLFVQIMELETQGEASHILGGGMITIHEDLRLDLLKINNPVEHFQQKLFQLDSQKLKMLKNSSSASIEESNS